MRAELMTAFLSLSLSASALASDPEALDAELAFFEYLGLLVETEDEWIDPLAAESFDAQTLLDEESAVEGTDPSAVEDTPTVATDALEVPE